MTAVWSPTFSAFPILWTDGNVVAANNGNQFGASMTTTILHIFKVRRLFCLKFCQETMEVFEGFEQQKFMTITIQ